MIKVLQIAGELGAYRPTDRGTWLAYASKAPLHSAHVRQFGARDEIVEYKHRDLLRTI